MLNMPSMIYLHCISYISNIRQKVSIFNMFEQNITQQCHHKFRININIDLCLSKQSIKVSKQYKSKVFVCIYIRYTATFINTSNLKIVKKLDNMKILTIPISLKINQHFSTEAYVRITTGRFNHENVSNIALVRFN